MAFNLGNIGNAMYFSTQAANDQLAQQRQKDAVQLEQQQIQQNTQKIETEKQRSAAFSRAFSGQVDQKGQQDLQGNVQTFSKLGNALEQAGDTTGAKEAYAIAERNQLMLDQQATQQKAKLKQENEDNAFLVRNPEANPDRYAQLAKAIGVPPEKLNDPEVQAKVNQYYSDKATNEEQKIVAQNKIDAAVKASEDRKEAAALAEKNRLKRSSDIAKQKDGVIDEETYKFNAKQYLAGDKSVIVGMGRNPTMLAHQRKAIQEEAKAQGVTPEHLAQIMAEYEGLKSAQRTAGTVAGRIAVGAAEVSQFIPIAKAAESAVPRTGFVPLNKLIQMGDAQWSPEQARFVAANQSVVQAFANAIAKTGAKTLHDTEAYEKMLNTAFTHDQYNAVIDQMQTEMNALVKAPGEARKSISGILKGDSEIKKTASGATTSGW